MKDKSTIDQAVQNLQELENLYDSDNIIYIGQLCNKLAGLTVNVGKQVSDARTLWKQLETKYKQSVRSKKLELIEQGVGVGKADAMSEDSFKDLETDVMNAENLSDRLKRFLDRCDKVLEANKQYCSTVKSTNLKGI
jgi:hypothetical protein